MNMLKITIIGSGDAFGSGGRLNTCFYVHTSRISFLIDCGATALPGLKKNKISPNDIDTIFISHFHGDHYGGLPYFLLDAATNRRSRPITIFSPPGCEQKVEQLLALLYPGSEVLNKLTINFIEFGPYQTIEKKDIALSTFPVDHSELTSPHGLRINIGGKTISYSGDTNWTENLIALAEEADLFICECNFFDSQVKGHLNYRVLKENVSRLNCKKLLLTHFDNEMLDNLHQIDLTCAHDGMIIEL